MNTQLNISKNKSNIENYSFNDVADKILKDNALSQDQVNEAINEFKKFFILILHNPKKPMAMMSQNVDIVWHNFILFTKQYSDFCNTTFGCYIHHVPVTAKNKINEEYKKNFLDAYKQHFGDLPKIWNNNSSICQGNHCSTPSHCGYDCHGEAINYQEITTH